MTTLLQDVKYGLRMLARNSGFTAVAVLSLAIGIGGNITIFRFVNALLFRPPAVEEPGRLLEVWNRDPKSSSALERYVPLCFPDFQYYREHNQVFSGILAFDGDSAFVTWNRDGQGRTVQGQLVSANFFSVLGVQPSLGRGFMSEEEGNLGAHPVVVLSRAFWEQSLGSDPDVLGRSLTFNGARFTVVGVAPPGFAGMLVGIVPDFWVPLAMTPQIIRDPGRLTNRGSHWLIAIGRLKPGVTMSMAQADMQLLARQIAEAHPEEKEKLDAEAFRATLVPEPYRGYVAAFTGLLMAVVGLVLLIACANVANLLLAKATARRREIAIRFAMGASRIRLIRQTLTESTLLAFLGGGAGVLLTVWVAPALLSLRPPSLPIRLDVPFDWRVGAFTLFLSLFAGLVFGLGPALRGSEAGLASALKDECHSAGFRKSPLRSLLVIAQVAVCLVLLIGAGLCLRSLFHAQSIDPGFEVGHAGVATLDLGSLGYSQERGKQLFGQLVERVEALPGVRSASLANYLPLTTTSSIQAVTIEGYQSPPGREGFGINVMYVGPQYFQTMGTPLLRGREFTAQDREGAPGVVIINEAMAQRFWPNQDPIGKRIGLEWRKKAPEHEIVGVVKTGKYRSLGEQPLPFLYLSLLQNYEPKATLVVRTSGDPRPLLSAVQQEVRALDPNLALIDLETLDQYMALPLFLPRTTGILLGVFGLMALILAMMGLYGVIAYVVSQRTHEIGIRMALGAERHDVLRLIVGQALGLTLIGVTIGLAGAFAATRALSSLLYGISPTDPATFLGVSFLLTAVALLASYLPARRATKVDPMVALRYE